MTPLPATPRGRSDGTPDAPLLHYYKHPYTPMELCPLCNKNLALVGRRHNCVANTPIPVANTVANGKYARYKDKEARKAYMRDYMRKKRNAQN
jgi:hypothetical protein